MLVSKVKIFDVEMCVYLERAQVRVDWEDVDQLQGGEDVGSRKQALQSGQVRSGQVKSGQERLCHLRDQCGVPGIPLLSGQTHRVNTQGRLKLHLKYGNFPRFFYCYEELNSVACRQPAFFWQPEMVLQWGWQWRPLGEREIFLWLQKKYPLNIIESHLGSLKGNTNGKWMINFVL